MFSGGFSSLWSTSVPPQKSQLECDIDEVIKNLETRKNEFLVQGTS